ncbi:MAG TPA: hypothetical protein VKQ36_14125 [Ktedonobacterales bacterium]|nr:hypothetical protein [Ktedonobacterales bacterium]
MAQTVGREEQCEDELQQLVDDTTELGVAVGDIFRNAAASLFESPREVSESALQGVQWARPMATTLRQQALAILRRFSPVGAHLRRVVELQQCINEFATIADHAGAIAQHGQALGGKAEYLLRHLPHTPTIPTPDDSFVILLEMIQQVYYEIRGCLIVCAARDTEKARRVVSENAKLALLCQQLKVQLDQAIRMRPREALPLHRLLLVTTRIAEIGDRAVAMCNATLYMAPQTIHEF